MTTFNGFKGRAKRLDDIDLPRVGHRIGVGEDEIHAVLEVEASGSGFDSQGRVKALYEPHKAYALSSGATRDKLVKAGLAYAKWGEKPYPKDSYPRILQAMEIDETIALKATSWGLGQIMGFNCVAAGYASPQAMVAAFANDEESHLDAMVSFIVANGLDDEIRRHDWAGFARGYNGSGYAKNQYDKKLAAAFSKWSKIKDTPWSPDAPAIEPRPVPPITDPPPAPDASPPPAVVPPSPQPSPGWLSAAFSILISVFKRNTK